MPSKRVGKGLAAALVLLWLTGIVLAQAGHTLLGRISLPNGTTLSRPVKVTLTSGGAVLSTFTDTEGRYSFSSLSNRVYEVTVEGDNESYETTTVRVEIFTLSAAPPDYTQNIQLRGKDLQLVSHSAASTVDEGDASVPAKARKEFQEGEKSAAEHKTESAIAHFTEAVAIYPSYYGARVALGDQYERLGRYDDAIACYKKAVDIKPDRVRAVAGLGAALTRQRKYSDAIPWLRRSVELDNQASISYLYLGLAELNTGDLNESERDLRKAYDIGKHAVAHIYLASLCEHRDDLAAALRELELFIKEAPDSPQAPEIRDDIVKIRRKMAEKR
jgi:tetratricopeptide (TPR) repeat protein